MHQRRTGQRSVLLRHGTAKANGLNPAKYIGYMLTALPERFSKDPITAVDDLLPWADKLTELCHM